MGPPPRTATTNQATNMNERQVLEGLIGTNPELKKLYYTNAWFKQGLDQLVRHVLPVFLRGLAENAADQDQVTRQQIQEAMLATPPNLVSGDATD